MRVLMLILASDGGVYTALQEVWRSYIHSFRPTVEAYFYKANPRLETPFSLEGDVLTVRCPDNLGSVALKLKLALTAMEPRFDDFDFICRPNLSSFFIMERYLKALEELPKTRACLAKEHLRPAIFPTGAGFTITPDIGRAIVGGPFPQHVYGGDDVAVGGVLASMGIKITDAPRVDITSRAHWDQRLSMIFTTPAVFHVRVKHETSDRAAADLTTHEHLMDHFYPHLRKGWKDKSPV